MIKKSKKFLALGLSLAALVSSMSSFNAFAAGDEDDVSEFFLSLHSQKCSKEETERALFGFLTNGSRDARRIISLKECFNTILPKEMTDKFLHGEFNQDDFEELGFSLVSERCALSRKDVHLLFGSSKVFHPFKEQQRNRLECLENLLRAIQLPNEQINNIIRHSEKKN